MNEIKIREPVLTPTTFAELVEFAKMAAGSSFVPRDYAGKPANIMLAVQMGSELGLSPMQAIQNISVINGRPSVWGDAMLALVRRSPLCEDVIETIAGEGDARTATCTVKRRGATNVVEQFSVADAKLAALWNKQGPWQQYPDRMLQMRARGFALRDAFPDVLRGLISSEEASDIPTIEARAEPAAKVYPQQTTNAALEESIPALDAEPAPKPDPVATVKKRLTACDDLACVRRVEATWIASVEKARAVGKNLPELLLETVAGMIKRRAAELSPSETIEDDDLGASL